MSGILALLTGGLLVGSCGHRVLFWLARRDVDPTVLLVGWILSSVGLVASAVAVVGLVALPADEHAVSGLFALAGGCWTALSSGTTPGWREVVAAVSLVGAVVLLLRLGWVVSGRMRLRRAQAPHLARLRVLASASAQGEPLWVSDERPLALSIGGRTGLIVVSDALRRRLPPDAVAATVEHERAHLRGRHHVLVAVAEVVGTALPVAPLLRRLPSAIKDLVELAADAEAARRCGPAAVREALCRLTGHPVPAGSLGMAGRLTQARIARLTGGPGPRSRPHRWAMCLLVAAGALLLPVATGWLAVDLVRCVLV